MTHKTAQNHQIRKDLSVSAFQGAKNLKSPFKKRIGDPKFAYLPSPKLKTAEKMKSE
jgi:hypothetical protein